MTRRDLTRNEAINTELALHRRRNHCTQEPNPVSATQETLQLSQRLLDLEQRQAPHFHSLYDVPAGSAHAKDDTRSSATFLFIVSKQSCLL
jgi:hypothetical protein